MKRAHEIAEPCLLLAAGFALYFFVVWAAAAEWGRQLDSMR